MALFCVTYEVIGSMTETFDAENLEAARAIANEKAENEKTEFDLDTVDDVNVRVQELYPVMRDGKKRWVSYVMKTDERLEA
jgi:hypothetical protein